jgi:16S rRNA (guanine527-N7)-methyltransferase
VYSKFCELIKPHRDEIVKLENFYDLHKNAEINLTAIKDKDEFYFKHYLDSIYIFRKFSFNFTTLIDVGSGGGFPGVVIAIFYSSAEIYLIESIKKKCLFLIDAINKCNIKNVKVINDRVENIKNLKADIITARAVDSLKNILKYSVQLSHKNTRWIIYKGKKIDDEINECSNFIKKNNLQIKTERVDEPFKRTYIVISY